MEPPASEAAARLLDVDVYEYPVGAVEEETEEQVRACACCVERWGGRMEVVMERVPGVSRGGLPESTS